MPLLCFQQILVRASSHQINEHRPLASQSFMPNGGRLGGGAKTWPTPASQYPFRHFVKNSKVWVLRTFRSRECWAASPLLQCGIKVRIIGLVNFQISVTVIRPSIIIQGVLKIIVCNRLSYFPCRSVPSAGNGINVECKHTLLVPLTWSTLWLLS